MKSILGSLSSGSAVWALVVSGQDLLFFFSPRPEFKVISEVLMSAREYKMNRRRTWNTSQREGAELLRRLLAAGLALHRRLIKITLKNYANFFDNLNEIRWHLIENKIMTRKGSDEVKTEATLILLGKLTQWLLFREERIKIKVCMCHLSVCVCHARFGWHFHEIWWDLSLFIGPLAHYS